MRNLVLIVLTAIVVASFVESGVKSLTAIDWTFNRLAKKPVFMSRSLAVALVYVLTVLILGGFFYIFIPAFVTEFSDFLTQMARAFPRSSTFSGFDPTAIDGVQRLLSDIARNASLVEVIGRGQSIVAGLGAGLLQFMGTFFGGVVNLLLVFVISFFFAIREKGIQDFLRIITPRQHEDYVVNLWERSERKIGLWFQGQLLLGVIVGLIMYIILALLGVQYALLIAITSAIFELVPFGFMISAIPGVLFAFLDGGAKLALGVAIVYVVVQQVESYILQTMIVKRTVGISPLVVVLAFLVGSKLGGLWGVILS
ncbi:MAG TPA: AI-2E family transporter, partial [Blastocatellia bacterium]|nr:AI-2E family transporter [Blastocatellia bacterium]